jgi:hypothetical protein
MILSCILIRSVFRLSQAQIALARCVPSFELEKSIACVVGDKQLLCLLQSVYLQQVGIIVFLAHIGCFVPASYAEIGMVDRIIARTNQDGELMESFAADLVRLATF